QLTKLAKEVISSSPYKQHQQRLESLILSGYWYKHATFRECPYSGKRPLASSGGGDDDSDNSDDIDDSADSANDSDDSN
ncbi:hypothetical protein GGH92_006595, partial [Coemansia sp. RSA 2673]